MNNRGRLLEVLHRAETGPIIDEKEFDIVVTDIRMEEISDQIR